jgi:hypothetical protein
MHQYKNNKLSSRSDEKWQHAWGQCDMIKVVSTCFNNIGKNLRHFDSASHRHPWYALIVILCCAFAIISCSSLFFIVLGIFPLSPNVHQHLLVVFHYPLNQNMMSFKSKFCNLEAKNH